MVAYAYAAQFPTETEKLVVMDAFLPGVAGWEEVYNNPGIWHFRFNGPTPEALVRGRERIYFDYFWNDFAADKTHSLPEADRAAKIEEFRERFANPYVAAERGYLDAVIRPRDTRRKLIQALEMLENKRDKNPPKKNGNIPL